MKKSDLNQIPTGICPFRYFLQRRTVTIDLQDFEPFLFVRENHSHLNAALHDKGWDHFIFFIWPTRS